jgi:hypothetical protein
VRCFRRLGRSLAAVTPSHGDQRAERHRDHGRDENGLDSEPRSNPMRAYAPRMDESTEMDPQARRRTGILLLVLMLLFVAYDVIVFADLFENGSAEDLDHASDRVGDLSTGPNAP